jgi:hypothetical protein
MYCRFLIWGVLCSFGAVVAPAAVILTEGFANVSALPAAGWVLTNNSTGPGPTGWFQGNPGVFPSQAGPPDAYIAANFLNATPGGTISNWLLTPVLSIGNGDSLSFFTRSNGELADRLEVRMSTAGASSNVGGTPASVGDFGTLLLSINPALTDGGYPAVWTQFTAVVSGLGAPTTGRFAFRYFVSDTNANGDYIGIDTVVVDSVVIPEPSTFALLGTGIAVATLGLRRRRAENLQKTSRRS